MAFPFLLGIGYFFYLYIFPIVKPMMEQNSFDYQRLVFPSLVLVFVFWTYDDSSYICSSRRIFSSSVTSSNVGSNDYESAII